MNDLNYPVGPIDDGAAGGDKQPEPSKDVGNKERIKNEDITKFYERVRPDIYPSYKHLNPFDSDLALKIIQQLQAQLATSKQEADVMQRHLNRVVDHNDNYRKVIAKLQREIKGLRELLRKVVKNNYNIYWHGHSSLDKEKPEIDKLLKDVDQSLPREDEICDERNCCADCKYGNIICEGKVFEARKEKDNRKS